MVTSPPNSRFLYPVARGKFTFAVCSLQLLTFTVQLFNSQLSAPGLLPKQRVSKVILPDQRVGPVCWEEETNIWLGFRTEQLVHHGAVYPPCIRTDPSIQRFIVDRQHTLDRASGCCIRRDRAICFQSCEKDCQKPRFAWLKNAKSPDILVEFANNLSRGKQKQLISGRIKDKPELMSEDAASSSSLSRKSGPVCGLDPAYCLRPHSWSNSDVTKWPVCERVSSLWKGKQTPSHMLCEVTARPCCIGIRGRCQLTTEPHCKLVNGQYHPAAAICSQVDCLRDVCGMRSFMYQREPNQIYRIFTALFVHAGFLQIVLSILVQLTLVRAVECQLGCLPTALVYILSGCTGNLTSLAILPYHVGVGPMPAQAGMLAIYLTFSAVRPQPNDPVAERLDKNDAGRWRTIKYFIPIGLLAVGFLPWLDNYANAGGFLSGLLCHQICQLAKWLVHHCRPSACCRPRANRHELSDDSVDEAPQESESEDCPSGDLGEVSGRRVRIRTPFARRQRLSEQYSSLRHRLTLGATSRVVCLGTVCTALWLLLVTGLVWVYPHAFSVNCKWCTLFTCLPLVPGLCDAFQPNLNGSTMSPCPSVVTDRVDGK